MPGLGYVLQPEYLFTYIDAMLSMLPEAACTVHCSYHYIVVMLYLLFRHIVLLGLGCFLYMFLGTRFCCTLRCFCSFGDTVKWQDFDVKLEHLLSVERLLGSRCMGYPQRGILRPKDIWYWT